MTVRVEPPPTRSYATGARSAEAGLLALTLIWGVNFSVIKASLEDLEPLAFNALRFPLASLVLYLVLRATGTRVRPALADIPGLVGLGLVGNVLYQSLFITGMASTTAGNASLLLATTPVWTLVLTVAARHERPTPVVWLGVLGTTLGMALVVSAGPGAELGATTWRGDLLMVGAAVMWSCYTVGARRFVERYGSLPVTAWTLWIGTLGIVLSGLPALSRTPLGAVRPSAWIGVTYAGVFAISIAYALWYHGVARLGNARTSAFSNVVPVVALVVAWLWLGERPAGLQIVGAVVVLASISLTRVGRSVASDAARAGLEPRPVEHFRELEQ